MPLDKPQNVPNSSLQTPYTIVNSDVAELGTTVATFYSGNTSQRPTVNVIIGDQFYNTQLKQLEIYTENGWIADSTAPQAPTNVTASNAAIAYGGTPAAIVKWVNATSGAPGATYTVTSSPGNITVTGTSSPLTISGLTAGTSYTFTVTATNTYGSATSSASSALTAGTISQPPSTPVATNNGGVILVAFNAPSNTGAAPITNYTATSNPGNISITSSTSPISFYSLTPGTAYTFTVVANNSAGTSVPTAVSNGVSPQNATTLSGGTVASSSDTNYYYETFTSNGTLTVSNLSVVSDILVIAGGGAGGIQNAGAGGAGGVQFFSNKTLTPGTYSVVVGSGGAGGSTTPGYGANGNTSQFGTFGASVGGGGGAGTSSAGTFTGSSGGSGGGGGITGQGAQTAPGGAGTSGQGNNGGAAYGPYNGGGGGGAGSVGGDANSGNGGSGGLGTNAFASWISAITTSMSGISGWAAATTSGYIAGGGAGGNTGNPIAPGGAGGGGNGSSESLAISPTSGIANTGSGGGAARNPAGTGNGAGGKGLVIVRYAKNQTVVASPAYTYSSTAPAGWYIASALPSTIYPGQLWPNYGTGIGADMLATGAGTVAATWRNNQPALTTAVFQATADTSKINQNGNMTWMMVAQHNGVNFSPFAGVGEWWGNYSPAYTGWYYHGLYGSWGRNTSSPTVIGGTKANGSYSFRVFQNSSYSVDTPQPYSQANTVDISPGGNGGQYIAEFLCWNANLSDTEINQITTALRAKYNF